MIIHMHHPKFSIHTALQLVVQTTEKLPPMALYTGILIVSGVTTRG